MLDLLAYATADLAVRVVPAPAARGLARTLAHLAFALRVPARRHLERNLARLGASAPGGPRDARAPGEEPLARRVFEEFALSLVDFMRLGRVRPDELPATVEVRGREHLDRVRASGRGVLLVSAHLGNWEWGAAYLAALGVPLRLVARPHRNPAVEAYFARRRARWGVRRLGGPPVWVEASRALREGAWVAVMVDRVPEGVRRGSVSDWAAALARRTGAAILPAVLVRRPGGRYVACFDPPLEPEACADGGLERALRSHLAVHPAQWFAFEPVPEAIA